MRRTTKKSIRAAGIFLFLLLYLTSQSYAAPIPSAEKGVKNRSKLSLINFKTQLKMQSHSILHKSLIEKNRSKSYASKAEYDPNASDNAGKGASVVVSDKSFMASLKKDKLINPSSTGNRYLKLAKNTKGSKPVEFTFWPSNTLDSLLNNTSSQISKQNGFQGFLNLFSGMIDNVNYTKGEFLGLTTTYRYDTLTKDEMKQMDYLAREVTPAIELNDLTEFLDKQSTEGSATAESPNPYRLSRAGYEANLNKINNAFYSKLAALQKLIKKPTIIREGKSIKGIIHIDPSAKK